MNDITWYFSKVEGGALSGSEDANASMFNDAPIISLTREICQNSIDASKPGSQPVKVVFDTFTMPIEKIPGFNVLKDTIERKYKYVEKANVSSDLETMSNIYNVISNNETIDVLKISDYNTTGVSVQPVNDSRNGTFSSL